MTKKKRGRIKRQLGSRPRDRRRWTFTLATDVPPGPQGQPPHKAGTVGTVVQTVEWEGVGAVDFPVPLPSALLLDAGRKHLERAARLLKGLPSQTTDKGWFQPGTDRGFTNEKIVFDFFEEAMAGVLLAHAAPDSYANELIPENFVMKIDGRDHDRATLEGRGIEMRLSRVLSAALGKPNLMTAELELWDRVMELKKLRDHIAHVLGTVAYSYSEPEQTIFARLLNSQPLGFVETVERVMRHYSGTSG